MEKFIIIDGNSLANRAFYAMPYLSNRQHQPSGAVFGFANLLVKLIVEQKPDYVAVAFDHARKTFRNDIFAEYKGTRKQTPPDLSCQFPVIKQMLGELGIKFFESGGIEADDIIGTLSRKSGKQNFLVSGDRDLLQLVNDNTQVWLTRKGVTDLEKFDEQYLLQTWGVCPSGVIELKALMGDTSDNIPGVPGIGEKTANDIIAYRNEKGDKGAGGLGGKISPSAVLVIQNGKTKLVNIKNQDTVTKILDLVPDIMDRITEKKDEKITEKDIDEMLGCAE